MTPSKPYIVGLTGGIACGKTHIASALRDRGQIVLDADEISRALTQAGGEALPDIRAAFGDAVFLPDGALDRRALGDIVFADEGRRARLEAIIHPRVMARMRADTQRCRAPVVFWDVPLLYETGMDKACDEVWCAYLPPRGQLRRLTRRDNLTPARARARIKSQISTRVKKTRASHVINTSGAKARTRARVYALLSELQRRLNIE